MAVEEFEDIQIIGADPDKTTEVDHREANARDHPSYNPSFSYKVAFVLSAVPTEEWRKVFREVLTREGSAKEAPTFEGNHMFARVTEAMIERSFNTLKGFVYETNRKYREQEEMKTRAQAQRSERIKAVLSKLRFD